MADLQEHLGRIREAGARVVAGSSDPAEEALRTAEELGLEFTVLHGLDARETSRRIGCYAGVRQGEPHIQPTGFVLDADGKVALAVYSSGKVGRLTAEDALAVLEGLPGGG